MPLIRAFWQNASVLICVCVLSIIAVGQNTSVSGSITDPQGNAIAGATITLTNRATRATRTLTSTGDGSYQIAQVVPGLYDLRSEAKGFKTVVTENVQVLVSTPLTLNITFTEVGGVTDVVTITGGESVLNTTDATLGNTFDNRKVVDLPLNARNVVGLLSLQPGVTTTGQVNGGRSDQANVTLDGIDVNEQQGGRAFFSVLRTTPDSLQEFRVTTTNPNADQGRSSGAQIALVTRSGTNEFHGSLYEYNRNTATTANDWFNNKAGRYVATDFPVLVGQARAGDERVQRPKLIRNNFGGAVGGPIKKDKLFFFVNYEAFRERAESSVVREVPTAAFGAGIVRYRTENGASDASCPAGTPTGVRCLTRAQVSQAYVAANGIDPGTNPAVFAALASASRRYAVNDSTIGDGLNTGGYRFNAATRDDQNTYIGRLDYNLAQNHILSGRFNYQNDKGTATSRFPDTVSAPTWTHPKGFAINHAWTINNSLVNNARYGLTRDAFTVGGDSQENSVIFRFVFQPLNFSRALSRTTPVHNVVDDLSWTKGTHSLQFGANMRFISNNRNGFGSSFDTASLNPSFYDGSGDVVLFNDDGDDIFANVASSFSVDLRDALTTAIGRFSGYAANLAYGADGNLQALGSGIQRTFKTQEYEWYAQDSWRARSNLTLSYGVRWSTSTPVYEANGVQVAPTPKLGDFFDQRVAGSNTGKPFNGLISIDRAGKANNRPGYYQQDWNNFAPSVSAAWSPRFKNGLLNGIFGENKTTLRGGFRITYDRFGSALAVAFDQLSTLGFLSTQQIAANTYNVSTRLAPQFTGFGQSIRNLPRLTIPGQLKFPLQTPDDEDQRIEQSLDAALKTPYNYSFNLSLAREIGKGYSFEASYVGRIGRNLLISRDVAHQNNLRDPRSGVDFYTAMRQLIGLRDQNSSITSVGSIPYFENLFPGLAGNYSVLGATTRLTASQAAYRRVAKGAVGGRNTTDYTFVQLLWDDGLGAGNNLFFHPQYATFAAYSTLGTSDFNSAQLSIRKRFDKNLSFDFNYTLSHSLDTASGNEASGAISSGASLILNPLDLNANRSTSDFDIRHQINANYVFALPFGNGQKFFGKSSGPINAILGGWQTTGIVRWNTGRAAGQPFDDGRWATNWNVQSNGVAVKSLVSSPTRTGDPNLFGDTKAAYSSFRNAYPGEQGDRNTLRFPSYAVFDMGLYKSWGLQKLGMSEQSRLQFRWEVYNLTNTQRFTGIANFRLGQDPFLNPNSAPADFGRFTGTQVRPNENSAARVMQFALRLEF